MDQNLKILVINLKARADRRAEMEKKITAQKLDFDFIEGVQGSLKEYEDFPYYNQSKRLTYFDDLSKGELGCAEAFCMGLKKFLAECNEDYLLILEDDAIFNDNFVEITQTFINERKGWDCIRFQRSKKQKGIVVDNVSGHSVIFPLMVGLTNTGLLLTRKAVEKVLPLFENHIFPADHILKFAHFKGCLVYEVNPSILEQDRTLPGDTETEVKQFKKGLSFFRKMEMRVYRQLGQGVRLFLMPIAYLRWKKVK